MKIFIENNGPNVGLILSYFVKRICFFVVFSIFSHHHFRHSSGNTGAFTVLKYIYLWSGSFTEFVGTFPGHFLGRRGVPSEKVSSDLLAPRSAASPRNCAAMGLQILNNVKNNLGSPCECLKTIGFIFRPLTYTHKHIIFQCEK